MKRTLLFISCLLASVSMSAQEDANDYIPFVELGKQWHVVSNNGNPSSKYFFINYSMPEEVERDGKLYAHTYFRNDEQTTWHEIGLFREENRHVYMYDENAGRDFMWYDFSLKEGDTFTYDLGYGYPLNCKVLKQGWLVDGPQIVPSTTLASADTIETQYRPLRTWTIGFDNGSGEYHELMTWVEGVGALKNIFNPLLDGSRSCLAYVERKDNETGYFINEYLPFSFYNMYVHGCDLPKGKAGNWDYFEDGWHHQLAYELEGDRLHVYGKALLMCGLKYYAYFTEEQTDDPLVRKLRFEMQGVGEPANCDDLYATDFYVSGFDPNINYIVVDSFGEEHPVINKTPQMTYRPFVEDDKVWKVGAVNSGNPVQWVEYYYFDGDTIIDGKTCLRMMNQRYINLDFAESNFISQDNSLSYVGAWYEENKQVYKYDPTNEQFKLMYDFSVDANDTLQIDNLFYVVGPKQTGGMEGFKGVYRDVRLWADGESIYSVPWLEGVGSTDAPITNVYPGYVDPAWFLMACVVDDEVIFLNDVYEDGATPVVMGARNRFDFTHTIKTKPQTPRRGMGIAEAEVSQVLSLYGEYNQQLLDINLNPLVETYLVRITDETGKAVYEKTINAGSIVALNIDISNYAEGRYTVTVENNYESFVGEFDTQTTGISDAERLNDNERMINDIIYNLQGQRIKSLQKGLNIVNGRKVYVK